jgi:hypothetical protein
MIRYPLRLYHIRGAIAFAVDLPSCAVDGWGAATEVRRSVGNGYPAISWGGGTQPDSNEADDLLDLLEALK